MLQNKKGIFFFFACGEIDINVPLISQAGLLLGSATYEPAAVLLLLTLSGGIATCKQSPKSR